VRSLVIRDADPERDLNAVVSLNKLVQDLHATAEPALFRPSDDMPGIESFHRELMTREEGFTFVAEVDDEVVGYACGVVQRRASHTFAWPHERLNLDQIAVHPSHRRSGVGTALMQRVDALADSLGLDEVALDSWEFNAQARRFFESLGYAPYNVRFRKRR
jgi:ribosomal protein S18 acetylase RimI-like enzyme